MQSFKSFQEPVVGVNSDASVFTSLSPDLFAIRPQEFTSANEDESFILGANVG